jgi:hypothetical protein
MSGRVVDVTNDDPCRPYAIRLRHNDLRHRRVHALHVVQLTGGQPCRNRGVAGPEQRRAESLFARASNDGHPVHVGELPFEHPRTDERGELFTADSQRDRGASSKDAE